MADAVTENLSQERVGHLVRLCARGFGRSLQIRLADKEVSFGQWVFLRILWETEGLTQRELSDRSGLTEPTVHTAMMRLEKLGFVERRLLPGNRRKQHAFLTEKGQALREELEPMAVEVNDRALAGLSAGDTEILRTTLITVLENLQQDEADAFAEGRRIPPTRGV